jgi:hypothetical protein
MLFRKSRTRVQTEGPVVYDREGSPVGVHVSPPPSAPETHEVRRARRLEGLRKTGELEAQYRLRCQVSLFCADPPR